MRPLLALVALALLSAFAAAQSSGSGDEAGHAALRIANLAGSVPRLTMEVDGAIHVAEVASGHVSGYRTVAAGDVTLALRPSGTGAGAGGTDGDASPAPDITPPATYALAPGMYYTLLVMAAPATDGPEDDAVAVHLVEDPLDAFPPAGHALVRVANALEDVEGLTAIALPPGSREPGTAPDGDAGADAGPETRAVALAAHVGAGDPGTYATVPAGAYRVRFRNAKGGEAVHELPVLIVHGGSMYTLYLFGRTDRFGPSVVVSVEAMLRDTLEDAGRPPRTAP